MSALNKAFASIITSERDWEQALANALGKKKYLPNDVVAELADVMCDKYKCYVYVADNGMYGFYKTDVASSDNIHAGAKKTWQRRVRPYHNIKGSNRGGDTSSQQDAVEKKAKTIKAWGMTKAQVLKAVAIAFAK
jgi:hypothetical protein